MTGWPSALAAAVLAGTVAGTPVFSFQDEAITESSGLVDAGDVVYTVNDSGSSAVLYAVDPADGSTRATTTYTTDDVVDVEAIAPAPGGDVWVGDIGDNLRSREFVTVYRVTPGQGDAERYDLVYPGGPRDAETLLVHPRTGRLYVVSKTIFGGTVYAAPRRLDPDRRLRLVAIAEVPGFFTDGAFRPDGRHVLLRGYGSASLVSFPDLGVVGRFDLPEQEQGEGISVGADGRILLSSEGEGSEVLSVELPPRLEAAVEATPTPTRTPSASEPVSPSPDAPDTRAAAADDSTPVGLVVGLLAGGALLLAAVVTALRSRRP